jgi:hypothetical protein
MDYVILVLATLGLAMTLYMKFSKKAQDRLQSDPSANIKYTNYKTNFLIVICSLLILFEGAGILFPGIKGKYDGIMAAVLLAAIVADTFVKRKIQKEAKK